MTTGQPSVEKDTRRKNIANKSVGQLVPGLEYISKYISKLVDWFGSQLSAVDEISLEGQT